MSIAADLLKRAAEAALDAKYRTVVELHPYGLIIRASHKSGPGYNGVHNQRLVPWTAIESGFEGLLLQEIKLVNDGLHAEVTR